MGVKGGFPKKVMSRLEFDGWIRISRAEKRERVCGRSSKQEGSILGTKKYMKDSIQQERIWKVRLRIV